MLSDSDSTTWLAKNIIPILALVIVIGGGCGVIWSPDTDVRLGLTSVVSIVVGYYFGTSKSSQNKDATIANLSK